MYPKIHKKDLVYQAKEDAMGNHFLKKQNSYKKKPSENSKGQLCKKIFFLTIRQWHL
jgi:hypothetical protein